MKLIVGLGNPGLFYINTRHNVGFEVIEKLSAIHNISMTTKHKALFGTKIIDENKIMVAMPQTFMNLSGQSVFEICNFYKISSHDVIVVHDDTDIELGKIKIKHNGSSAGHNGIKNIIDNLGTENFVRIRVGIGKKPDGMELNNYVLGKFSDDEKLLINNSINEACTAIKFIITENVFAAMNKFNTRKGVVEN